MGADEAIVTGAVNRVEESAEIAAKVEAKRAAPAPQPAQRRALNHTPSSPHTPAPAAPRQPQAAAAPVETEELRKQASELATLDDVARHLDGFDACPLKRTATRLCFADGLPGAHLMVVGEAPGREEDEQGRPFVGRSGQLLDKMLNAAGFDRTSDDPANSVFITNTVFWRPPGNRNPTPAEIEMCMPFVYRAIELAKPKVILVAGNIPSKALLQTSQGITRMRGTWRELDATGAKLPVMATFHPSYLLRSSEAKRHAWQDVLSVKLKLKAANSGENR